MPKKKVSEDKEVEESSNDKESELVEILDEEDEKKDEIIPIDENKFREFLEPVRSSAPVLEEVTAAQEGPVFVRTGGGGRQQTPEGLENDDPFKYANQGGNNGEDPKYVSMSSTGDPLERIDFQTVGREQELITREVNLTYSSEAKGTDWAQEKLMSTERFDPLKVGTQEAIEKEKKKKYWIK